MIVTHSHADFDALAALVAASKIYPGSAAVLPELLNANVRRFVNLYRELLPLKTQEEPQGLLPLAVVVDTRRKSRLGPALALVERAAEVHIIDHHPPAADDLEGNEVIVEPVGATTTILVEAIRQHRVALSQLEASLLALGIYENTGSLSGIMTTARDAAAAAFLWEEGLKMEIINEHLRPSLSAAQKALLEKLVEGSELYELRRRRILISSTAMNEYVEGVAVLIRHLQEIEDVELAVALVRMEKGVYLAVKALSDEMDLPGLFSAVGARGHRSAVSAFLATDDLAAVKNNILELLEGYIPPALTAGEVATAPLVTVPSEETVARVMDLLYDKGFGGCPVMEEGRMVGMIARRDLAKALRSNLGHAPVKSFMKRQVMTAGADCSITALRRMMVEHNIGRIPVLGSGRGGIEPVGIVTRSDILRALERLDRRSGASEQKGCLIKFREKKPVVEVDNLDEVIKKELSPRQQGLLLMIGQRAERLETRVYLVGGFIRDLLLGYRLPQDLDLVVFPDAVAFARDLEKLLGGKLHVYEQFGTATLYLEEGLRLDLATARQEFYAAPAALPRVEETSSLKSDLFRRDFTINTLACSLMPGSFGKLYDFFAGREDLSRGVIRTLYNLSFADDPLRILRAVRFEHRFGFTIDENTMELIGRAVKSKVLEKVSRHRLNHEVSLIYKEREPVQILRRLDQIGVLSFLYPSIRPDTNIWQRLNRIGDTLEWARRREWKSEPDPELLYLGGLLYDLEPEKRFVIMRRLHFSRERTEKLLGACREVPGALDELSQEELRPSRLVKRLEDFSVEALLLLHALSRSGKIKEYLRLYLDSLQHLRPRLKGGDLKKLGLEPGPQFQEILQKVRAALLDGQIRTPEEELQFVLSLLERRKED